MRRLATIRTVREIRPIEGADSIEVAVVDGWECVVKKGEFYPTNRVVYIEIDSIVPEIPEFEFLRDRKFRVRTIKLRKQISQGLVMPLSILSKPEHKYTIDMDVTDELKITKYDPEAAEEAKVAARNMKIKEEKSWIFRNIIKPLFRFNIIREFYIKILGKGGKAKSWPSWITKTDEERIQNRINMFNAERDAQTKFYATEKLDGCSATYFLHNGAFGVCSRNVWLKTPDDSHYWKMAKFHGMEEVLAWISKQEQVLDVVLQGEIIGEGIQKNKYKIKGHAFYGFNLELNGRKIPYMEMHSMLSRYNVKSVPLVNVDFMLPPDVQDLVAASKGKSVLLHAQKREGIVVRSNDRSISFKVINPEFLLAEE